MATVSGVQSQELLQIVFLVLKLLDHHEWRELVKLVHAHLDQTGVSLACGWISALEVGLVEVPRHLEGFVYFVFDLRPVPILQLLQVFEAFIYNAPACSELA